MERNRKYTKARFILLQDSVLSLIASLLSILLVRWLSDPIPGYTTIVMRWLAGCIVGSLIGFLVSGSWKIFMPGSNKHLPFYSLSNPCSILPFNCSSCLSVINSPRL